MRCRTVRCSFSMLRRNEMAIELAVSSRLRDRWRWSWQRQRHVMYWQQQFRLIGQSLNNYVDVCPIQCVVIEIVRPVSRIECHRAYSNGAVQPILCSPKSRIIVQSKLQNCAVQNMCFELSHKSTTRVILSSAASAAVAGVSSWQLVYPTSRRSVPYQPIALLVCSC